MVDNDYAAQVQRYLGSRLDQETGERFSFVAFNDYNTVCIIETGPMHCQ